ncbi:hypothetical protein CAEBREN_04706 [Caenorhabditis brenneri]|uniref:Uncharacterized protein n=1 Tax=Caenorhabditis brenneri TaxID=135651 RepID=G0NYR3_CAEBE|nr:hypothetical protein CAEBREN_04706 [Caenorhabditis brenneri]
MKMKMCFVERGKMDGWCDDDVDFHCTSLKLWSCWHRKGLYETFPDIASSLTLPIEQMEVKKKIRTPKNHLVSVNGNPLEKIKKNFANQHRMWKFCLDGSETNLAYEVSTKKNVYGRSINKIGSNFLFFTPDLTLTPKKFN